MDKLRARFLWPLLMLASLIAFTGAVFAAGSSPPDPSAPPDTAGQFWQAVANKQWGLAAVIGTMLFVAFVRFVTPKLHGKLGAFVQQSRVSAALAFLGGALSAVSLKMLSGLPWSTNLVSFGFTAGLGAIGGYNAFWDLLFPNDTKKKDPQLPIPPPIRPGVLLPFVFLCGIATVGCAPGTDGLRQACANANVTLTQTTLTGTMLYKLGHQKLRENLTKDNADATQVKATSYNAAMDKFLVAMLMLTATKSTVCDAADAIDAGAKKDIAALTAQAGKVIIDAAAALAELEKLIDTSQKTSDINRRIALVVFFPRAAVL